MNSENVPMSRDSILSASEALSLLERPETPNPAARNPRFASRIAESKAAAVEAGDQEEAKRFWIAEAISHSQLIFENAFELMKEHRFYDAWCKLEECEITIASLERHFAVRPPDRHRIGYIRDMVERWQSLYPYKIFFSPEILKQRVECSICDTKVSLRNPCGHEKGQIYDGEQCYHIVTKCEFLSISAVENPVQKYSVGFLASENGSGPRDHYDYAHPRFAIDRLASPYHGWYTEDQTRTIQQSSLSHHPPSARCPCGSGNEFGCCCKSKPEVVVPHLQFIFSVPPPPELPQEQINI
ncbi:hypothetical protein [Pseudoduganella sp. UC29_71]|uniref:hypothetical protein n=1 Tax=Pseudoduganella sp. UC29_71 TaxID=3350174 RepID=UPI00366DB71E